MLTEEQLKNLKKGDKVLAEVEIDEVKYSTVSGIVPVYMDGNERRNGVVLFDSSLIHLMPTPPKYDPTRRFKKGDRVRVVKWNGRVRARTGMEGRVVENERNSMVELAIDGWTKDVFYPACHLELVTPVEEMKPYSVETDQYGFHIERYNGEVLATYNDYTHPDAYEAAVDECKRLIAEWRKEHQNED